MNQNVKSRNKILGLIVAMRPKQWIKNILVIVAVLAAWGADPHRDSLLKSKTLLSIGIAFVCFCLAASSIYLINDAKDVDADRAHPTKCNRPIASGWISPTLAYVASVVLIVLALGFGFKTNISLGIVILVYIVFQLGYCFGLKHQAVIDIAIVSSGFLLRAIAGGVAAGIPLSRWFLLVMAFGSLFMAAGKRYAELHLAEMTGAPIRKSLQYYTTSYLRFVYTLAATSVVISYSMWALDGLKINNIWYAISMAPFTVAILRYAVDIDEAKAGSPEDIALKDRVLQGLAVLWLITILVAAFKGVSPNIGVN